MADAYTFESVIVAGERIEPGKLIWRRYRRPAPGMTEVFLDINPHLREHLRRSIYLPVGVAVLIPISKAIMDGKPTSGPTIRAFGEV